MTQLTQRPWGVVIETDEGKPNYLPLEEARVQAQIIDGLCQLSMRSVTLTHELILDLATAKVTLTQTFKNASEHSTPQTRYVFPLPARSAVCAFEMWTDDGRHIRGVAKERKQAAQEHKQAIKAGKLTSLVEWSTDDGMFF